MTILAHSFGGLVSLLALESESLQDGTGGGMVESLFTFATPFQGHPLGFHLPISSSSLSSISREGEEVSIVSIFGGDEDLLVHPDLTSPYPPYPNEREKDERGNERGRRMWVYTGGIPGVWTGMDHETIWYFSPLVLEE